MRKSRLVWRKQTRLIELFVAGSTARTAASLVEGNKTPARDYFLRLRQLIYEHSDGAGLFEGDLDMDEPYFGGQRQGKRGRGAAGKVPVFGLLKRRGKVYAVMIAAAKATTVLPIIRETVKPESLVSAEGFKGDNAMDVWEFKHDRIHHRECCVERPNHSNGLEKVWNQAKRHLRRVNRIARAQVHLYLYLKE